MCGGCSREGPGDWLSPIVPTRAAREVAARTVTELVASTRLSVRAAASGFTVLRPTGRVTVAPTLSAVWDEVALAGAPASLAEPATGAHDVAEDAPLLPHVPTTELVLLLASSPERVTAAWTPDRVVRLARAPVSDVLETGDRRVLVVAPPDQAREALTEVTSPGVRLRATVVGILRDGEGPGWADDLADLADDEVRELLGRGPGTTISRPALGAPAAAAWAGGLVATGRTSGQRLTLRVAGGRVTLDAADGTGLSVRPTGRVGEGQPSGA